MKSIHQAILKNPKLALISGTIGALFGSVSYHYYKTHFQTKKDYPTPTPKPEVFPVENHVEHEQKPLPQTLRVTVTGAAGQIAYSFLPMLASGLVFGPNVSIELRLLDIPASEEILKGVEMELYDGAYPLLKSIETGSAPKILFKDADVVVFLGGFPRKQGQERKELLEINGKIFKGQGEALNEVAKKDVKCLVVANPANTNCLILQKYAPEIPKENFTCLTRLDLNRARHQV